MFHRAENRDRAKVVMTVGLVVAGSVGTLVSFGLAGSPGAASVQAAPAAEAGPLIPARIECAMLVQDGAEGHGDVRGGARSSDYRAAVLRSVMAAPCRPGDSAVSLMRPG